MNESTGAGGSKFRLYLYGKKVCVVVVFFRQGLHCFDFLDKSKKSLFYCNNVKHYCIMVLRITIINNVNY